MEALNSEVNWEALDVTTRWRLHKQILRSAGEKVRRLIVTGNPSTPLGKQILLGTLSRTVWNQDVRLASLLLERSEFVREHIFLIGKL